MSEQQGIHIGFRFDYFHEKDVIQFSIKVGPAPPVAIGVNAEGFFTLSDSIVKTGQPFLENVKKMRIEGGKEDISSEFDMLEWEKMMGEDKEEKGGEDG